MVIGDSGQASLKGTKVTPHGRAPHYTQRVVTKGIYTHAN